MSIRLILSQTRRRADNTQSNIRDFTATPVSERILPIPEIPPALRDASQRGVLIPFVGAGVSRLAGCPSWDQLADGALNACIAAKKFTHGQLAQIKHLPPRMKLSIARGIDAENGLNIDYAALINPERGYERNESGHRVYRSLGKLAKTFVTTNYDSWLDTEMPDVKFSVAAPATQSDTTAAAPSARKRYFNVTDFTPFNLNQPNSVFHLHGSLADPAGMIMTTRDYIARYANDRAEDDPQRENRTLTFLSHLFQEKTVLFVGYGLEDLEILEYVIQKAQMVSGRAQHQARHFMLQGFFAHENELMRSLMNYYKQCDIQLMPFSRDEKNWFQLMDALDHFAEVMPAAAPLNLQIHMEMESLLG
jgi:hypothetical protein